MRVPKSGIDGLFRGISARRWRLRLLSKPAMPAKTICDG